MCVHYFYLFLPQAGKRFLHRGLGSLSSAAEWQIASLATGPRFQAPSDTRWEKERASTHAHAREGLRNNLKSCAVYC